ncbi:MAG: hypothetical protein HN356_01580 [Calditrichaeota bacterium]|jgi:Tol biopolymer transport system component|nr:hypothetical protein [Calditrichota bacterium]MBT7615887.1 hypothetical protein [Calditrichota bacterium]MBT7788157.1 hypothetical protein [Calditrichota bacterium]
MQSQKIKYYLGFICLIIHIGCNFSTNSEIQAPSFIYTEFSHPVLSPNGEEILFHWFKPSGFNDENHPITDEDSCGIWSYKPATQELNFIYAILLPTRMIFTPDGDSVIFNDLYNQGKIVIMDRLSQSKRVIPGNTGGASTTISNDGSYIAYNQYTEAGKPLIIIAKVDGREYKTLSRNGTNVNGMYPNWFPGNHRIAFMSNLDYSISAIDTSGENLSVLFASGTANFFGLSISPADGRIVFTYLDCIYTFNSIGENMTKLSSSFGRFANWSFDGKRIIYTSPSEQPIYHNQNAIWIMNDDGAEAFQIYP